jgi:hypothetical protein
MTVFWVLGKDAKDRGCSLGAGDVSQYVVPRDLISSVSGRYFFQFKQQRGVDCLYILVPVRLLVEEHIFEGK